MGGKVMSNIDNKQAMPKATEGSEQYKAQLWEWKEAMHSNNTAFL